MLHVQGNHLRIYDATGRERERGRKISFSFFSIESVELFMWKHINLTRLLVFFSKLWVWERVLVCVCVCACWLNFLLLSSVSNGCACIRCTFEVVVVVVKLDRPSSDPWDYSGVNNNLSIKKAIAFSCICTNPSI